MSGVCTKWGHMAKIKSSVANNKKGGYKTSTEDLVGTTRLCTLWHAIGHKVRLSINRIPFRMTLAMENI